MLLTAEQNFIEPDWPLVLWFSQFLSLFNRPEILINIYRLNSKHLLEVRESPEWAVHTSQALRCNEIPHSACQLILCTGHFPHGLWCWKKPFPLQIFCRQWGKMIWHKYCVLYPAVENWIDSIIKWCSFERAVSA